MKKKEFSLIIAAVIVFSNLPFSGFCQNFSNLSMDDVTIYTSASMGNAWADYNSDGFEDLYVCNYAGLDNFFFRNNGDGTFERLTGLNITEDEADTYSASWGDYNNDGFPDLFLANYNEANHLYLNNGGSSFTRILTGDIVTDVTTSWDASWVDYNNDGHLDMFVATNTNNLLYKNMENGTFEKVITGAVVTDENASFACSWGDYNNDGFQDLFIANYGNQNNAIYKNIDGENFQKVTVGSIVNDGGQSRSISLGDYNNDGFVDVYVTNSGQSNFLYKNNGDETFEKITNDPIVTDTYWSYSSSWNDYNNDGFLDMFIVNSTSTDSISLFMNNKDGSFTKIKDSALIARGSSSWSLSSADFDKDGFNDLYVASRGFNESYLYHNNNSTNNYLGISLEGVVSNKSAIGARVMVKSGGIWQTKSISGSTGRGSQNGTQLTFGLEAGDLVDSIRVIWPSGVGQVIKNQSVNQYIHIIETDPNQSRKGGFTKVTNLPLTANGNTSWASAWGDYDDDGDMDMYVSNYGEPNFLYKNRGDKSFEKVTAGPAVTSSQQSWSSTWVDYDNDYDLDLYVVNGYTDDNNLYSNNQDGTFTGTIGTVTNTSDINANNASWADYDNDGDLDLFIANGSNSNEVTRNENNSFYINNGNQGFIKNTTALIANDGGFSQLGSWGDYDNDGDADLVVLNTFMDNFFYDNNGDGSFTKIFTVPFLETGEQPLSASWGDFNNDGFLDLLIGAYQSTRLFLNNGDKTFYPVQFPGLSGNVTATTIGDFNNDGYLDVVFVRIAQTSLYYINNGDATFRADQGNDLGKTTMDFTHGAAAADYDNDGDLDLFINNDDSPNVFMENNEKANNWIRIKLRGGNSNSFGVGAKVRIKSNGIWQMREINVLSAYRTQNSMEAAFGLGKSSIIDSVKIEWPLGIIQIIKDVGINQVLTIQEEVSNPYFTKVIDKGNTPEEVTYSRGSCWIDYNNDGYDDLFVSNDNGSLPTEDFLFENNKDGSFTQMTTGNLATDKERTYSGSWADYDNDGDNDLCLSTHSGLVLYTNSGSGAFTKTTEDFERIYNRSLLDVAWADYDNDGLLDLYGTDYGLENELFKNNGNGFDRIVLDDAVTDQDKSYSVAWADYDNDGDLDLFVSNREENSAFYENNGDGSFTKITNLIITQDGNTYAFSGSWADYNNDGFLDLFVCTNAGNSGYTNFLYKNNGDKTFSLNTSIVSNLSANSAGSAWADFNNDGFIDLFVANQNRRNNLYINNGDETFSKVDNEAIVFENNSAAGSAWSDFDKDGDQDLFVPNLTTRNSFYVNNGNDNSWITLKLEGITSNKSAIGARVVLHVGDSMQIREVSAHTGYRSQNSLDVSFGVGMTNTIDSIIIKWPSGIIDTFRNIETNKFLDIREGMSVFPVFTINNLTVDEDFIGTLSITPQPYEKPNDEHPSVTYSIKPESVDFADISFDSKNGEIVVKAIDNGYGSQEFTLTADNGNPENNTYAISLLITVNSINDTPILETISSKSVEKLSPLSFTVSGMDVDIPTQMLEYHLDELSKELGMTIDKATGEFNWKPSELHDGNYTATIIVSDGLLSDGQLVDIQVKDINKIPHLIHNKGLTVENNDAYIIDSTLLKVADEDNVASELIYTISSIPMLGKILKDEMVLDVNDIFTQTDINDKEISYQYSGDGGNAAEDFFSFKIEDIKGGIISDIDFAILINQITGIGETNEDIFRVYPNPFNSKLTIGLSSLYSGPIEINLIDLQGRILKKLTVVKNNTYSKILIDTSELPEACYVVTVTIKEKVQRLLTIKLKSSIYQD